jgi:aminoglycoside 3-N-acetyltransferase
VDRRVTSDRLPSPPHRIESPVGRVDELNRLVVLLGVLHDSDITIHLAEVLANVPYGLPKHVTDTKAGRHFRVDYLENDRCCQELSLIDWWLRDRSLQRPGAPERRESACSYTAGQPSAGLESC